MLVLLVRLHVLCLAFWLLGLAIACPASEEKKEEPANESSSLKSGVLLSGMTSVRANISARNYEGGMRALELRFYKEAERRLEKAWFEFRKNAKDKDFELLSRLGLGEAYIADEKAAQGLRILEPAKQEFVQHFGKQSLETGRLIHDLAKAEFAESNPVKAMVYAHEALAIRQKILGNEHHDTAVTLCLLARIQDSQGMYEDAADNFSKALSVLELHPGGERLDYAEALYGLAAAKRHLGDETESRKLAQNAAAVKDAAVRFDKTPATKGIVKFAWENGISGSRQIPDPVYPLKYIVVNGLRVACTVVRSDKHMAVLISLANCSKQPIQLAVGPVVLEKTSPGRQALSFCDPALMDIPLEEERISDHTWRRRWLCHIQKTRRIPGYLQNGELDPENFFGNNVFGLYGNWDLIVVDAPPVVTREHFIFDQKRLPYDVDLLGFMRGSSSDIRPTLINPGDARTGLVFFLRQRYETARVRLIIGNAQIDFPFQAAIGE